MSINLPEGIQGLSSLQAKKHLEIEGYNELPAEKKRHLFKIIIDILREPMIFLLLACITIYAFSGDLQESIVLGISILFIVFISVYQESKTEKALEALKSLSSPRAFVWRDGECIKLAGREVVREDVVLLKEGDRVPADGIVIWNKGLSINESLLTGESMPVTKSLGDKELVMASPQGENTPFVYSGSMVVAGQGIAIVKAIGRQTEMGRIGKMLDSVTEEKTPLQKNFGQLVHSILIIALILCLAVVILNLLTGHGLMPSFLSGITLAMAILPEEFPVVLVVFLSIGAWRLSHYKILVRRLSVVESLGAATTLCVDKTGTITMNQMKVDKIYLENGARMVDFSQFGKDRQTLFKDEILRFFIKASSLASNRNTFDPLEGAIKEIRREFFHEDIYSRLEPIREYPLSSSFLVMTNVWRQDKEIFACAKGAPELVMSLSNLSQEETEAFQEIIKKMAQDGLRVLGVAYSDKVGTELDIQKIKFKFLGLLGFMDPVRPTAAAAIKECYQAGINVKMITGDYSETAKSIAKQIGLKNYSEVVSGQDFINLNASELKSKIKESNIFARMMPEYKLQIVRALKHDGQVVAMTGDGVNDGPALKAADIGVAMGAHGTDVARESSDIVLLDDNFSSLVSGVKEGRRIFDNLQRAVVYLVAVHLPVAALSLIPIVLGWPLLFFPVHIMFLELLVDPVCSIVFEAEPASRRLMDRPPRNSKKSILNRHNLLISFIQGLSILLFVFLVYYLGVRSGLSDSLVRTTSFVALVSSNIFLILVNRSWSENVFVSLFKKNLFLWPIIILATIFLLLSIYNPFLRNVFNFAPLSLNDWFGPLIFSLFPAFIFEFVKTFKRFRKI